jgi:hypothetical protein
MFIWYPEVTPSISDAGLPYLPGVFFFFKDLIIYYK